MPLEQPPSCHHWLEQRCVRLSGSAWWLYSFTERATSLEMSTEFTQRQAEIILTYLIAKLSLLDIFFLDSDRKCLVYSLLFPTEV